ncbi:unnamed protein product [Penicillium olsonii]|nr:unnamed protein product [Penicillium olsonii]
MQFVDLIHTESGRNTFADTLHRRTMFRRITHERVPEYEGRDVLGKGFKEDSVVDPDEM